MERSFLCVRLKQVRLGLGLVVGVGGGEEKKETKNLGG